MKSMIKNKSHSYKYYSSKRGNTYRLELRLIIRQTYIYISLK
jgi:Holliday junction resolvase RusA-like endonuclease